MNNGALNLNAFLTEEFFREVHNYAVFSLFAIFLKARELRWSGMCVQKRKLLSVVHAFGHDDNNAHEISFLTLQYMVVYECYWVFYSSRTFSIQTQPHFAYLIPYVVRDFAEAKCSTVGSSGAKAPNAWHDRYKSNQALSLT